MKRIILFAVIISTGVFLFAQENKIEGKINKIDPVKKEILVSYEQVGKPYIIGDKLYVIIDEESVTLEVIFPMQTVARCKLTAKDAQKFGKLQKGMLVYADTKGPEKRIIDIFEDYNAGTPKTFDNIEMVFCPSGSYFMGAVDGDKDAEDSEKPRHIVILDSFWIGKYEVTQKQYKAITGNNMSYFTGKSNNPVEQVSWYDSIEFCNMLSAKVGRTPYYLIDKNNKDSKNTNVSDKIKWTVTERTGSNGFRLPTEAEWEYACRAGSETIYYWGNTLDDSYLWYIKNSAESTHQVGTKKPNKWGLYDMSGNVWEWCWDWYVSHYNKKNTERELKEAEGDVRRVLRSGSWAGGGGDAYFRGYSTADPRDSRSSFRNGIVASTRSPLIGFRVVCSAQK